MVDIYAESMFFALSDDAAAAQPLIWFVYIYSVFK